MICYDNHSVFWTLQGLLTRAADVVQITSALLDNYTLLDFQTFEDDAQGVYKEASRWASSPCQAGLEQSAQQPLQSMEMLCGGRRQAPWVATQSHSRKALTLFGILLKLQVC